MQNTSLCQLAGTCSFAIGGAESRRPSLPAIRALQGGKFNQGVYSVKNLVKRAWYCLLSAGGEQQQPHEEARCSN
jgi:hypothetical protein